MDVQGPHPQPSLPYDLRVRILPPKDNRLAHNLAAVLEGPLHSTGVHCGLIRHDAGEDQQALQPEVLNQVHRKCVATQLLLSWGSWVTFFYPSRIFVNNLETVLMMTSFYLWIKRGENRNYDLSSRLLVGVNFAVRGTSIIFWIITWVSLWSCRFTNSLRITAPR